MALSYSAGSITLALSLPEHSDRVLPLRLPRSSKLNSLPRSVRRLDPHGFPPSRRARHRRMMPRGASTVLARYANRWPVLGGCTPSLPCRLRSGWADTVRRSPRGISQPATGTSLRAGLGIAAPVCRSGVNYVFFLFNECCRAYASIFCGNGDRDAKASDLA